GGGRFRQSRRDDGIEERHHGAELGAKLFNGVLLFGFAFGQEIGAAFFVLFNPCLGKAAIADFSKKLFHSLTSLLRDNARPGVVIAVFGGIADGVAHVAKAATIDKVYDEFEFV